MYGYEPPSSTPPRPGGCREAVVLIRVAFEVIIPFVLAGLGGVTLIGLAFVLFSLHPAFALLPVAVVAGGIYWLARRERQTQLDRERTLDALDDD